MTGTIKYITGDATQPIGDGKKIIAHICNNEGKWGKGFVLAISNRWTLPEANYRALTKYTLGEVQYVDINDDLIVANMIAQNGVGFQNGKPPISYGALRICLAHVNNVAYKTNATIHAPMFGTGLSGGNWNIIEQIIKDVMSVPITIYVLDKLYLPKLG